MNLHVMLVTVDKDPITLNIDIGAPRRITLENAKVVVQFIKNYRTTF